jgi:hypothetical protein
VIVASHHPSEFFDQFYPGDVVGTAEFRAALAGMPNVIAHLCGHTHRHRVTEIDGLYPYLQIETASLMDFPQEGRVFDVYYDEALDQVRLTGYVFGHAEAPTRLSAESLRRAEIDAEITGGFKTEWSEHDTLFPGMYVLGRDAEQVKTLGGVSGLTREERYGTREDREIDHRTTRTLPTDRNAARCNDVYTR